MALPSEVQKQADKAQQIQEDLNKPAADPATTENPDPALPVAADPLPSQEENWKKRFVNYKASTDQTIHELRETVRSLLAQAEAKAPAATAPTDADFLAAISAELSQEERDLMGGDDILRIVARVAQSVASNQVKPVVDRLETSQNEQARAKVEFTAKQENDEFFGRLTDAVRDWKAIDVDPRWNAWMLEADPASGRIRRDLQVQAYKSRDVQRVAQFYTEWQAMQGKVVDPKQGKVMPGAVAPGAPSTTTGSAKIWSREEVSAFYNDKRAGKYKGREAEADQTENDIFAAQREGRIR